MKTFKMARLLNSMFESGAGLTAKVYGNTIVISHENEAIDILEVEYFDGLTVEGIRSYLHQVAINLNNEYAS